jgi:hypothetical protein
MTIGNLDIWSDVVEKVHNLGIVQPGKDIDFDWLGRCPEKVPQQRPHHRANTAPSGET